MCVSFKSVCLIFNFSLFISIHIIQLISIVFAIFLFLSVFKVYLFFATIKIPIEFLLELINLTKGLNKKEFYCKFCTIMRKSKEWNKKFLSVNMMDCKLEIVNDGINVENFIVLIFFVKKV